MDVTNFSLLSALYDNADANLYSEIYYPIIKYALFYQMKENSSEDGFSNAELLAKTIKDKFDIYIPTSVLSGAVRSISKTESDFILYEHGNSFKVTPRWSDENEIKNLAIKDKASLLEEKMKKIEDIFQIYLKDEEIVSQYTFIEFFSSHTEEILRYLQGEKIDKSNERYMMESDVELATLMRFIQLLQTKHMDMYEIAENFFWAAIVAAFLQRDENILKDRKNVIKYYLDTSLILSFLDLSDEYSHKHVIELKNMIEASGHVACVHPMTLREVNNIIDSSIQNGMPDINSKIYDAYKRRNLTNTMLQKISLGSREELAKGGFCIYKCTDNSLDAEEQKYLRKKEVIKLSNLRGRTGINKGDFREIHDIYIGDFIKSERKKLKPLASATQGEQIYFLTMNTQLIDFWYISSLHNYQLMVHPNKIVAELWINGSLSKKLKRSGLSENISRCLAANHINARTRINTVARCSEKYIEDETQRRDFCKKAYKHLVRQSNKVIPVVEEVLTLWNEETISHSNSEKLRDKIAIMLDVVFQVDKEYDDKIYTLNSKLSELEINRSTDTKELNRLRHEQEIILSQSKQTETSLQKEILDTRKREEIKDRIIYLNKKLQKNITDLDNKRQRKQTLEQICENSIQYKDFYIRITYEIIIVLILSVLIAFLLWNHATTSSAIGISSIAPLIAFFTFIKNGPLSYIGQKKHYKEEQIKSWKQNNIEYEAICKSINSFEEKIPILKDNIEDLENELKRNQYVYGHSRGLIE